tara:strand:+ start:310 stop:564 length:255 start_codon:yes stop_codon:yes gene_type:complete
MEKLDLQKKANGMCFIMILFLMEDISSRYGVSDKIVGQILDVFMNNDIYPEDVFQKAFLKFDKKKQIEFLEYMNSNKENEHGHF